MAKYAVQDHLSPKYLNLNTVYHTTVRQILSKCSEFSTFIDTGFCGDGVSVSPVTTECLRLNRLDIGFCVRASGRPRQWSSLCVFPISWTCPPTRYNAKTDYTQITRAALTLASTGNGWRDATSSGFAAPSSAWVRQITDGSGSGSETGSWKVHQCWSWPRFQAECSDGSGSEKLLEKGSINFRKIFRYLHISPFFLTWIRLSFSFRWVHVSTPSYKRLGMLNGCVNVPFRTLPVSAECRIIQAVLNWILKY